MLRTTRPQLLECDPMWSETWSDCSPLHVLPLPIIMGALEWQRTCMFWSLLVTNEWYKVAVNKYFLNTYIYAWINEYLLGELFNK